MKILKLTAENFKKLSAVEITPDGNVVLITGKNGAGKSSVLDAPEAALRGERYCPKQPIKIGEVRAKVMTELGEDVPEYRVTRKFFGTTSVLTVEAIGENTIAKIKSPQAFLDSIVGNISFDPLAFLHKQPAEQRNTLMEFLGLNLEEFGNKIATLKAERSEVRKEKERKLHEAESITTTPNLPPQEVSSESLLAELQTIQHHNDDRQTTFSENAVTVSRLETVVKDITAARKAIEDWKDRFETLGILEGRLKKQLKTVSPFIDSVEVEVKIKSLSATNEAIRRNAQKKEAMAAMERCVAEYSKLGDDIKVVENQKAKKLAETVMPIEGLSILSDGLGYNGLPLEQECQSKRLKICVAIAMAMNPELQVLRIDGNGLDTDSLVAIGELVAGKDYQVWIEKVSDDNKIGFYIEDGNLIESDTYHKPDVGGDDV
jgi:DNA repair exonuclease SbcCD ATPase subunit